MTKGILLVISAPSGCGKSTIVHRLMEKNANMSFSVSATTRNPREGEINGKDYFFVSKNEFQLMIQRSAFLEYAQYAGNYYGTPAAAVMKMLEDGKDVILEIDVQGAAQVKDRFPEALTIFIMPPSMEVLRQRLTDRGTDSPEVIERRMENADRECSQAEKFDQIVINYVVEDAVSSIEEIIQNKKEKMFCSD